MVKLNINQNESNIIPLNLQPPHSHRFSIFSLQYSIDGSEIIGGSNDTHVYIYDLQKQKRTLRVNISSKRKFFIKYHFIGSSACR